MNVKCMYCGIEFDKEPSRVRKTRNSFCCKSHAAKFNNRIYTKRKPENTCLDCGKKVSNKTKRCGQCKKKITCVEFGKRTLRSVLYGKDYTGAPHRYVHVRRHAKQVLNLSDREKKCGVCGYNKHVEVCHIKPIASFGVDNLLSEVNSLDNLLYLCPNCHWEYDNGGVA